MTAPGGPAEFNLGPIQKELSVAPGTPGATGGLSKLPEWDQPTVEALLKALYVQQNGAIQNPLATVYNGLRQGISLPLAVLESLINRLMGTNHMFLSVEHALAFAKKVPVLSEIVEILTGVEDGDLNDLGTWGRALLSIPFLLPQLFQQLNASQSVNLSAAGGFPVDAFASDGNWSIDLTRSRTDDGTGAAKVTADGTVQALRARKVIPVAQSYTAKVFVAHSGYEGSGVAIRLQVVPHIGDEALDPVDIGTYIPSSADLDWPGHELSGTYTVPEGSGVTGVKLRIVVTGNATAGTFEFDDVNESQSGRLKKEWIDGLPEELQSLLLRANQIVETIIIALRRTSSAIVDPLAELAEALQNINPVNILGWFGAETIRDAIQDFLDHLVGGAVGQPGTGASLPDLFNVIREISARASRGDFMWIINGINTNKPVDKGLLPSGDANYPYSNANTWLPVTQSQTLAITYRAAKSEPLGAIGWLGKGSTNITAAHVNVRKIDKATASRDLVHHSPNLVSLLPPGDDTVGWVYYQLADEDVIAREITDEFEVQVVIVGTGTHWIRGYDEEDDIPDHPYANVKAAAAVRDETVAPDNPPASIPKAAVVKSARVPWIELAVDTGSGTDHYDPQLIYLGTNPTTIAKPKWANAFDLMGVGGSGGGRQATLAQFGEGGWPGQFNAKSFFEGEDFDPDDDVIIDFTPGAPGTAGTGIGGTGGDTVFTFLGGERLRCAGGAGGDSLGLIGKPIGRGYPDPLEYNGQILVAGGHQKVPGGAGIAPGGAGNGGDRFFNTGGPGALGGGWVYFYRRDHSTPPPDPVDTTPPTPPTTEIVRKTYSTITVRAVGSVDE
ncbi:glycine-rich domain-containing protein [Mycolicibacterium goodii]|uniref:glycine-rich domain-containing protein n=1 Tax=Mycolicibacterium goodii TaxID=134601 RepID=UPI001BDC194A|nr:hypothetical protein [Mycolicibacterium goodii]MBU8830822.1 hypothetical protein [Mycolicibacterium goodii]